MNIILRKNLVTQQGTGLYDSKKESIKYKTLFINLKKKKLRIWT